jgi:hypothetical protein
MTESLRVILEVGQKRRVVAAIPAYDAEGRPARTWPIQFLTRRTRHHVMDHAGEMEDRDQRGATIPA